MYYYLKKTYNRFVNIFEISLMLFDTLNFLKICYLCIDLRLKKIFNVKLKKS